MNRALSVLIAALLSLSVAGVATAQTLTSDRDDYSPGETATLTGSGFAAGELVRLQVLHADLTGDEGEDHEFWMVTADYQGAFVTTWHVCEDDCINSTLRATAVGQSSGLQAEVLFTDSPKVGSVTVAAQVGTATYGSAGSVTYVVTVNRGSGSGSNGSFTATLSITSALPAGATASFSPNAVSFTPQDDSKTATLTINTPTSLSAGTTSFTARASTSASDNASGNGSLVVSKRPLVGSVLVANKIYDGTAAATITARTLSGVVGSDDVTYVGGTATFNDENAGIGKLVSASSLSLTGTASANYTVNASASTSADITPRTLAVSASAQNKIYDGTAVATVTLTDNRVAGDALTTGYASASFNNKHVGNAKPVSVSGISVSGADADNYIANTSASSSADITARTLVVSASGENKIYDGITTAAVTLADDRVAGDALTIGYASAGFNDKNVGNARPVSVSGISISGNDAANYLANTSTTTSADITARTLAVSASGQNKIYDGNATAAVTLADDRVAGDALTTGYASASFNDKNVGNAKPISVSGISVSGADAGNYLANTSTSTSADITARTLAVSASGQDKVYDGNVTATATLADDRVAGDALTTGYASASFNNKHVGNAKPVSVSGISVSGADAGNYLVNNSTSTSADITARTLAVSASGQNKIYDGNTTAVVTLADDRVAGDALTTGYASASFNDKHVGNAKPVSVSGISVSGADAGNYLANTSTSTSADITARTLAVSASGQNKIYDGNTTAAVTLADDRVAGDALTTGFASASFNDKNVGNAKLVSVSGISVSGTDAGNYVANTSASTSADITARALAISASGQNKIYDGNATAVVTLADDRVADDALTTGFGSASFNDKNVGNSKPVSVMGISVSGADAGNYVANTLTSTSADISARTLAVAASGQNKIYDGNVTATVTLADDRVAGDALATAYGSASFSDKNVGNAKPVSVSGISVSGADAGNYVANTSTSTSANITVRSLLISASGQNKIYDGNATAVVTLADDRVAGDALTIGFASASFNDKNVSNAKPVSVTGISVSGADAGNYVANTSTSTSADITPRTLAISASGQNKIYDGTTSAAVTLADNRVTGDALALTFASAAFVDKNVGSGKTVNVSGVSVTGADAGNYSFNSAATTTATILPATLTVKADNKSMTACQTTPALTVSLLGFVPGEAMITSGVSGLPSLSTSANSSVPGAYPITVTVGTLTASNYQFAFTNGTLTVLANPVPVVTITGPTAAANVFPVNVPVQFSGTWTDNAGDVHTAKWLFDGVIATDPVTVTGDPTGTGTASTSHVFTAPGVYMITLRMADPCGATGQSALVGGVDAMVVIYDPSAGFVTGGGWINSPAGAYRPDPSLSGKANFGFESKYAKGARTPTGETEFQFKVGNLNFHSTAYEWLVISGPNAQYKGTGTVNGVAGYDFMLTARDAELDGAGSNSDKFRMKIIHHATDAVVYDNQFGTPDTSAATTALGGGSIVIHQVKGGNSVPVSPASLRAGDATLESTTGLEFSMAQNAPNPFRGTTAITFTLPVKCTVKLTVFDVAGREVVTLANEERDPGQHVVTWSGNTKIGHSAERGVYFVRLSATPVTGAQGFTSLKKMALLE